MAEERIWTLIQAQLAEIVGKLDTMSKDVSRLLQAGTDVERRLSKEERCNEELEKRLATAEKEAGARMAAVEKQLERHAQLLGIGRWLALVAGGSLVVQVVEWAARLFQGQP
jgi:septation ring formation regulator EzrA